MAGPAEGYILHGGEFAALLGGNKVLEINALRKAGYQISKFLF